PDQIGYSCNENLYNPVACAPCWLDRRCDFGRGCMETIPAAAAIEAAERMLAPPPDGPAVHSYQIALGAGSTDAIGFPMKSSIANPGKGRGVAIGLRRVASRLVRPVRRLVGATCLAYARGAGIGDHIMLSTVVRELKRRGHRRVFVFTEYPELFRHNADVD